MKSDDYVLAACFQVKAPPNNALELTGLSCAKFEVGFAVVVRLLARLALQSRPAAQLFRYAA